MDESTIQVERSQWFAQRDAIWQRDLIIAELVRRLGGDVTLTVDTQGAMGTMNLSVEKQLGGALRIRVDKERA
jgi:Mg-chelatase subunit ChlD